MNTERTSRPMTELKPLARQYQQELEHQDIKPVRGDADTRCIVHIGVGGFHRAHLAWYQERLNRLDPLQAWSIIGVGLLPGDVPGLAALQAQQCLYTLTEADQFGESLITIAAIREVIAAAEEPESALAAMAAPTTRIISTTVTEGGYLYDFERGTFREDHPQVQQDIAHPDQPTGLFGYLRKALHRRRVDQSGPVALMSCDNVPGNGDVFKASFLAFLYVASDHELTEWVCANVSFPNAMVDRITPTPPSDLVRRVANVHKVDDKCPLITEPFAQWVLEDNFVAGRPAWERVGAEFTRRVEAFENLKIRLLNATHTTIAQVGLRMGVQYIHELMEHPGVSTLAQRYMEDWAAPTLAGFESAEIDDYAKTLQRRFSNPAVRDSVERVATDGFSRIKNFLVPVVRFHLARGEIPLLLALPFACWLLKLQGRDENDQELPVLEPALSSEEKNLFRMNPEAWLRTPMMFGQSTDEPTEKFLSEVLRLWKVLPEKKLSEVLNDTLPDN